MREIKFRAWFHNGEKDCKGQMLYDIQFAQSGNQKNDWICICVVGKKENIPAPFCFADGQWCKNPFSRQMFSLMQFTGLLDKNGKEIYEDDIVECWFPGAPNNLRCRQEVMFVDGCFGCGDYPLKLIDRTTLKVIGNIYKNPELLEKEEKK